MISILLSVLLCGCAANDFPRSGAGTDGFRYDYGVFLGFEGDLSELSDYRTVVIDAQSYTAGDIASFKAKGHTVYSYINVGALEDFRSYYPRYSGLALGQYEHWDEEVWIDVSDGRWRDFILCELAPSLTAKGIDGFFADNCDVYYNYPEERILDGLAEIMRGLRGTGPDVLINGGDTFLDAYCGRGGDPLEIITGINQETVFSSINWTTGGFGPADAEDSAYFREYVKRYAARGAEIYLLEYSRDRAVAERALGYCADSGFHCYISPALELLGPDSTPD